MSSSALKTRPGKNVKSRNPIFLEPRPLQERPFYSTRKEIARDDDILRLLSCDDDASNSFGYEVIEEFCDGSIAPAKNDTLTQTKTDPARAWIDFRSKYRTSYRLFTEWYTATELKDVLNEVGIPVILAFDTKLMMKTFSDKELPDMYRQLIFVPNLDREFVLALASSMLHYQRDALHDALYKHIACEASLRVVLPVALFATFRLEFSLPHLKLEEAPIPPPRARYQCRRDNLQGDPPDISFLKLKCRSPGSQYILTESQFTLVIICWDGTKWAAYAFANNAEEAEELDPNDTSDDNPEEDCIAAHTGNCLNVAEDPIFDPRLYGLIHIEKDIEKYTEEWSEIHGRLKKSFKKNKRPVKFESMRYMDEFAEWMVQAIPLYGGLSERLSMTVRTIERFISPGGDRGYFADMSDFRAISALQHIEKQLEILQDLRESLHSLESRCEQIAKAIELHTGLENSRISLENSRLAHEAHITSLRTFDVAMHQIRMSFSNILHTDQILSTNQIITPLLVVTAYYSTQQPVFGFERNGKTFIFAVILVYVVLRTLNIFTVLARRYIRSEHFLALIALGRLERLFDMKTEHDIRDHLG